MHTLSSALAAPSAAGEPLPPIWPEMVQAGVEFRRGQLVLIAAGPGGNKSVLAMNLALRMHVPALYVSADTDTFTTGLRVAALLSGHQIPAVEAGMRNGKADYYRSLIDGVDYVRWAFESTPTVEDIEEDVECFGHVYGCYPELVVVDNLMNVFSEEDDNTGFRHNLEALNQIARASGACVVVLHHTVGEYESGDRAPNLGSLMGKVGKLPSLILTLYRGSSGDLAVCVVKNRFGPASPQGYLKVWIPMDPSKARIG